MSGYRETLRTRFAVSLFTALLLAVQIWSQQRQSSRLLDEGIILLKKGRPAEAADSFNRFKQSAPGDPRAYFYAGVAMAEAGKLSLAALELSEAVRLAPGNPEYNIFRASILSRLGHKVPAADALAAIRKTGIADRLETAWLWLLNETWLRLENPDEALKILDLLARRNPADARVDLDRGKIFVARGEVERALSSFRESIAKSARNPGALFELGKIHYQRNEMPEARKALFRAVQLAGDNHEYLHQLGLVCLALNEAKEAVEFLKRAEKAGSTFPQIYYALGNAYQRAGNRALAVEYRKRYQAVVLEQRFREDRNREAGKLILQGEKQLDEGNRDEARRLFERAAEANPDN